ncbi:HAD family hydrolase [Oceanobacillus salinisoli]|uniref:HAD family hydrolase n=1 Tax=Oceanobacillus salinisoli TaxID=2678611 RepID=UPI0012E214F6|nr:HAD family hydrolase [Oceanobacillus salinisoli]
MINFVWFDLGYTLVYLNREEVYQERLSDVGVSKTKEEITLAYHLTDKFFMREHPGLLAKDRELYAEYYQSKLHEYLRLEDDVLQVQALATRNKNQVKWKAFKETLPTLQQLKQMGIGLGLISNWDLSARDVLKQTNIFPLLDYIIVSSEVGMEKPDKGIFEYALNEANVQVDECLYVGDNYYDDVIGSRKVGMDSVVINPFGKVGMEELKNDVPLITNVKEILPIIQAVHV